MLHPAKPNLLYLVHRMPYPPDKGDRIRAYHLLRFLGQRANLYLACLADEPVDERCLTELCRHGVRVAVVPTGGWGRWARALWALARGRTASEGAFWSAELAAVVRAWAAETRFDAALASA